MRLHSEEVSNHIFHMKMPLLDETSTVDHITTTGIHSLLGILHEKFVKLFETQKE